MKDVKASTITDDQILALRGDLQAEISQGGWTPLDGYDAYTRLSFHIRQCDVSLGLKRARKGSSKALARARCAELFNLRMKATTP